MRERAVLIVEGQDDVHVLSAIFKAHQVPHCFTLQEVKDAGSGESSAGVDRLLKLAPLELKSRRLERIGLVLDANQSLPTRWRRLRDLVAQVSDSPLPDSPTAGGT